MLQNIHQQRAAPRASSLYCRWICEGQGEGARLTAVWIDSEMRGFEKEFAANSEAEAQKQDTLEEPGGIRPEPRIESTSYH